MTAPLPVDIEAANALLSRFTWLTKAMIEGRIEGGELLLSYAIAEALTAVRKDYEDVLADKRRLTRELDIAIHGEKGAARQASLCDLIEPVRKLRSDLATYGKDTEATENRIIDAEFAKTEAEGKLADAVDKLSKLRLALLSSPCPLPISGARCVKDCVEDGNCGCDNAEALKP